MSPSDSLPKSSFASLLDNLEGDLLFPDAPSYDDVRRVWNGVSDLKPGAIARCINEADVIACVNFVRENGIQFSVRSGGHDYAGLSACDGGLLIDLSLMKTIGIDPEEQLARIDPGVTWGEFDADAQQYGLAASGGTSSGVGVAGYTLGGGTGYNSRKHGLALDNLIAAEIGDVSKIIDYRQAQGLLAIRNDAFIEL